MMAKRNPSGDHNETNKKNSGGKEYFNEQSTFTAVDMNARAFER